MGGDDGHDPEAVFLVGAVEVGADVVELAVIPAAAVRLLELQDGNVLGDGEGMHFTPKAIADLLEESRGGDGMAEVGGQEADHLAAHLEVGDIGVEVEAVDAFHLQGDVAVEEVVDVHWAVHEQWYSA